MVEVACGGSGYGRKSEYARPLREGAKVIAMWRSTLGE
jgi:hypothetical protein